MRIFPSAAITVGALALAGSAAAQTRTTFRVGGVGIEVTPPTGYCEPSGAGVDIAQILAAGDNDNVTDLTLFPCSDQSGEAPDYYLIKTPKTLLLSNAPRAELLASLRAEFDKPGFVAAMKALEAQDETSDAYTKLTGQKIAVTGSPDPMGLDETCAYLGGVIRFESKAIAYSRAVGTCITSVGNRVVIIHRYSTGEPGNVPAMIKSAKALALAMEAKAE